MTGRRRAALEGGVLLLLLTGLAARSLQRSQAHFVPMFDEVAYLDQAREFSARGVGATIACYLRGECRDDNRHPLYSLLAAPLMDGGERDFPREKLLTLGCALLLVLVVYGFAWSSFGAEAALPAAGLAALSFTLAFLAQDVLCDVLLAVFYVAALGVLLRWRERLAGWLGFGALAGAAYLTKGTGHFLLLAAPAVVLCRPKAWRRLGAVAAGFAAVAGFLLWRNLLVWGNPFHNVGNHLIWLDDWSSLWRRDAAGTFAQATAVSYWRGHTVGQALGRVLRGLGVVSINLLETAGPGPTVSARPAGLLVVFLAGLGLRACWREGKRAEVAAIAAPAAALTAALVWAAAADVQGTRFMLPIVASLLPAAAVGLREAVLLAGEDPSSPLFSRVVSGGLAGSAALGLLFWVGGFSRDPRGLWSLPPHWAQTSAWMSEHARDKDFLIAEDSYFSLWNVERDRRRAYPFESPDEELIRVRDARGLDFVLLDSRAESYGRMTGRFSAFDENGPLTFLGWPRCFHDSLVPSEFEVFCRPKPWRARAPAAPSR